MKHILYFLLVISVISKTFCQCPTVNAGDDIIQCTSPTFQLNGIITNGGTAQWTTSRGGNFAPSPNLSNPFYTVNYNGAIENYSMLILNSTKAGCPAVQDTMYVFYQEIIVVKNGFPNTTCCTYDPTYLSEITVCSDTTSINVYGLIYIGDASFGSSYGPYPISSTTEGIWSTSGSGTFTDPQSVNTTYTFSSNDILNGSVSLTLTSTYPGDCANHSSTITVTITNCTGISNNQSSEKSISIYPNPAKESFTIESSFQDANYELSDLSGKMVRHGKVTSVIDIYGLDKGVYLLKIQKDEKNYYSKVFVE